MENKRIIRFYDEKHQIREILVNDECLFTKKKISLYKVTNICAPELIKLGYEVKKSNLQRITLTEACPYKDAFRLYYNCNGLCIFTFECVKDGETLLAVYVPYGKLVHILEKSEYEIVEKINNQQLQLNLHYLFCAVDSPVSQEVKLLCRIAYAKRSIWGRPYLELKNDRCITKTVDIKHKDAIEAFGHGYLLSEKIQDVDLFELTKF